MPFPLLPELPKLYRCYRQKSSGVPLADQPVRKKLHTGRQVARGTSSRAENDRLERDFPNDLKPHANRI